MCQLVHEYWCFIKFIERVGENHKMRGLLSIVLHFRNGLIRFNNTGARMLGYIYHMLEARYCCKNVNILPNVRDVVMTLPKSENH